MAYHFKLGEDIATGFARIGGDEIGRVERVLAASDNIAGGVHEVRKSLKRIRALLRLARTGLGEDVFRRENARFREVAALLADSRDRHVMAATIDRLERRANGRALAALAAAREALVARSMPPLAPDAARERMRQADRAFRRLDVGPRGFSMLADGLEASYRLARRALRRTDADPSDDAYHRLRKGVQAHWRQMLLLSRAWPAWTAARTSEARELSHILGDDHDLAVLAHAGAGALSAREARTIERLCRDRQAELRARARPIALRLLAEPPARLRENVEFFWRVAGDIARNKDTVAARSHDAPRALAREKSV